MATIPPPGSPEQVLLWRCMLARTPGERPLPAPAPAAAKAAISPSALVLAGAGTAAGLLVGLPALVAVAVGAGCWGIRVGVGAALAASRRNKARRPEMIDPYAVAEPWRGFVRDAMAAQSKFDLAVARCRSGPMKDRLADVSARVHDGVRESWRVAHLGAALDATVGSLNPSAKSGELRRFQASPRSPGQSPESRDETEAAIAAQLQAARRVEAAAQRANDRLRVLTAQLNSAVAAAVELSLDASDTAAASQLAGEVDSVVSEIETLRRALEESSGRPSPSPG